MSDAPEAAAAAAQPWRGLLAIVVLGLVLVTLATVLSTWPSDWPGQQRADLVHHWERTLTPPPDSLERIEGTSATVDLGWIWRRAGDGAHYSLIISGLICVVIGAQRGTRWPWSALVIIGALGVLYSAGMALYNGPMIATAGYFWILLGALFTRLGWAKQHGEPTGGG